MNSDRKGYYLIHWLGIVLFPVFYLLDLAVYPEHKSVLLLVRYAIALYLALSLIACSRLKDRHAALLSHLAIIAAAASISFMCFITGDGTASPYFSGLFLVLIAFTAFANTSIFYYLLCIGVIFVIHFSLICAANVEFKGLAANVIFLLSFAIMAGFIQRRVFLLLHEIKTLKGLVPICARCKKIRDDAGSWQRLEHYIKDRADVEFTHDFCPDCAKDFKEQARNAVG